MSAGLGFAGLLLLAALILERFCWYSKPDSGGYT